MFYQEKEERLLNFDFLRGFFIFLAFWQHFAYYMNVWFLYFFKEVKVLDSNYQIYKPLIGYHLAVDDFSHWAAWFFTPWVSQIYLTLAAFNLAKRNQEDFKTVYSTKIKVFGLIFLFFIIENFVVSPNFGEAISFYPIMAWMIILAMIAFLYQKFGVRGVWFLFIISFTRWTLPPLPLVSGFEYWVQSNIHSGYEFDAQIQYFLSSGCMGFLLGYYFYHKDWGVKRELWQMGLGLLLFLVWFFWGERFTVNHLDVFQSEHDLAKSFLGSLSILGIQLFILPGFIYLEKILKVKINAPIINWVGVHSLALFAIHRVMFVHIFAPFILFIGTIVGNPLPNVWWIHWISAGLVFLCGYYIKKSQIHNVVFKVQ